MGQVSPLSVIAVLAAAAYVALGVLALRRKPLTGLHHVFAALCAAYALWSFGFGFMYSAGTKEAAWAWDRFAAGGWAFFAPISLHFCMRLARRGAGTRAGRWVAALAYVPGAAMWLRFQTATVGAEIDYVRLPLGWTPWLESIVGWYGAFQVYVVGCFGAALVILLSWMRRATLQRERRQAAVVAASCTAALVVGIGVDQGLERILGRALPPMSAAMGLVWAAGVFVAMTRHQLLALTPAVASAPILETVTDMLLLVDQAGTIRDANRAAVNALGRTREELIGAGLGKVFGDPGRASKTLAAILDVRAGAFPIDLSWVRSDGSAVPVWVSGSPIRDTNGDVIGCVVVGKDASERIRMEDELVRVTRFESVGVIARGLSHEFNNLLTGITGYLDLARTAIDEDHRARAWIDAALDAAEQARLLAQRMQSLGRGQTLAIRDTDLGRLVSDAAPVALRGSRVRLEIAVAPDLPRLRVDEGQVVQVLHNLLINAREAMSNAGSVTLTVDRFLDLAAPPPGCPDLGPGDWVRLTVRDHGPGIPPEHLPRVFDAFYTTKPGGSGLGLASCRSIVRRHGGGISVESRPGEGATFRVWLPVRGDTRGAGAAS
ncbi:MAG: PAS domain S-box protein [Deltaproteobacteria bacterium]|nr:PAS domain S-box protein [Deltaproteobacteria bacterium]